LPPQPERITDADLEGAIAAVTSEDSKFTLASLREAVGGELHRRLADPELVKELPGTGLIQIAKELLKLAEEAAPEPDPLLADLLNQPGFPDEKKVELAVHEIGRLREEMQRLYELVTALDPNHEVLG
jgi:hypothetical protein